MKTRLQSILIFAGALLCASAWFALWLTAFHPQPVPPPNQPVHPSLALYPAQLADAPHFTQPTLFALPVKEGFSGTFPESRVYLNLKPEHPQQPDFFLQQRPHSKPLRKQIRFIEPVSLPQSGQLTVPGVAQQTDSKPPTGLFLILSPKLQARTDRALQLKGSENLPAFVRIQLKVDPEGAVSQCFFETPLENDALARIIRALRFNPAPTETDGWLELRNIPEGDE